MGLGLGLGFADLRVRVDAEAAVEHAREACELGENECPSGQAAPVARQHKLERRHVDGLSQGSDSEHRRRTPQLQPLRRRHAGAHLVRVRVRVRGEW